MRKVNPSDICSDFNDEIDRLASFLTGSITTTSSSANKSLLAELVFHRGYVAVESFLSAWIVGAINRHPSSFFNSRKNAIRKCVVGKFSQWDAPKITYTPPKHIPVADLKMLLDPDGWNITFKSFEQLKSKCVDWLAPTYLSKINAVPEERQKLIDASRAIRNCIAHQSQGSFAEMRRQLSHLPNSGICKQLRTTANSVTNVGSHLKAIVTGKTRVELYLQEFKSFGQDLA